MWDIQTLKRLNQEAEDKARLEDSEGEAEFEEARKQNTPRIFVTRLKNGDFSVDLSRSTFIIRDSKGQS